ncbi:MAG: nitrogen fixation protein NifQ [Alphaproteobacteria bacterium]|nr:nitrogen fixation protein NifQ [Alphaproteobacteria bacterium]
MAANGGGDPFDRHVFACVLAIGVAEAPRPLPHAVGLSSAELARLVATFFPEADWLALGGASDAGPDSPEEADLRRLLEDHATRPNSDESRWLAAMVARRSLRPSHLWQDLGLAERGDLSRLLRRHFGPLAARNTRDMKWKKFFYRTMCEQEGLLICKSPVCDDCADFGLCFGPET